LSVLIAVTAILMIGVLEAGLVLPAFSILLFAEAAIVAIVAGSIHVHRNSEDVTSWDIAGAFTMMGCAAAIFSEPDQAARFFEQPVEQHPVSRCRRQSPGRAALAASRLRCRTGAKLE
jgi:hypothetical protein